MTIQFLPSACLAAGLTWGFGLLGASTLSAAPMHEDDPKILDRKAPVAGTGWFAQAGFSSLIPSGLAPGSTASAQGPATITLGSWLTTADLGNGNDNGNDCWGYTSPSGREYALMGVSSAMVVVEVTNPSNAQVIGRIAGPNSTWRDIRTYQDRAYVVSEGGGGIQVVDLSNVDNGVITLETSITGQGTNNSHNVVIDEDSGFLYRTGGGSNGLRVYDLANPSQPVFVGQWNDRYVHDAQVVTYTSGPFAGKQVAFCCAGLNGGGTDTGLTIVDVTNKANMVVMSQVPYPSRRYSHQGWLSPDRSRFYLGDELDEGNTVNVTTTRIFDVTDLNNATYTGAFDNGDAAIGHNMFEKNGVLFQANYTSGLRMFDVQSDQDAPVEVAFYDTAPNSSNSSFNGLWGCFPYFPSGTVIGSDIERGLFVFSINYVRVNLTSVAPALFDPAGSTLTADFSTYDGSPIDPSSPMLVYDIGAGPVNVAMTATGAPGAYTVDMPSFPCGTSVTWFITGSSAAGASGTFPAGDPLVTPVATGVTVVRSDEMEAVDGWVGGAPGDTATTGMWERGNPNGTSAQPEDDHTVAGVNCWFTGQANPGAGVGSNDVDGGFTTLLSPQFDLSASSAPILSYYRWYSNDQGGSANNDVFDVEISSNGGGSWSLLERVGPSGAGTSGGWVQATFDLSAIVPLTSQVQLRFIASDLGNGSIVEAAIDDLKIEDLNCVGPIGSMYCTAVPNSTGNVGTILAIGSNQASANDLDLLAVGLPPQQFGLWVVSAAQAFVPAAGGSQGNLCVGGNTGRYNSQVASSGAFGEVPLDVDTTAIQQPNGTVPALPGETWNFQCWHRDLNPTATSNFTRGFSVTFQ